MIFIERAKSHTYLIYMLFKLPTKWLNDKNGPEKKYRGKLCNVTLA